ncbi:peptide chain release factor H [Agarivorans sp. DSG3-1]|uniref:peptide chain release factor H n=1 Tax=Agarivorans sp. DSG3-1 TaxID=3342249 RepID=UPI00398E8B8C
MILLQLSAGQGPLECCKALGLALKVIEKQCKKKSIHLELVEVAETSEIDCFKSILLKLEAENPKDALQYAESWQGPLLWVCRSTFRLKHKRRNWYFSGRCYEINEAKYSAELSFQTCRASGAGGQHVNTTDSAVRAIHIASGLSVRVESERSQHANKRMARTLLIQKLEMNEQESISKQEKLRWQHHWQVERGNPIRTFTGEKFRLLT